MERKDRNVTSPLWLWKGQHKHSVWPVWLIFVYREEMVLGLGFTPLKPTKMTSNTKHGSFSRGVRWAPILGRAFSLALNFHRNQISLKKPAHGLDCPYQFLWVSRSRYRSVVGQQLLKCSSANPSLTQQGYSDPGTTPRFSQVCLQSQRSKTFRSELTARPPPC